MTAPLRIAGTLDIGRPPQLVVHRPFDFAIAVTPIRAIRNAHHFAAISALMFPVSP
jgi:hypothetical protein